MLKDINYKKMITNRILVTVIMILLEFALMMGVFVKAIRHSGIILTAFYLLGFMYVIYLVCKDENASYRIGWILVILILPPFGTFLYMLWGDKKPSRKLRTRLADTYKEFDHYLEGSEEVYKALAEENPSAAATTRNLKKTSRYPLYQNRHVT